MKYVNHTEVIRRSKRLAQKGLADLANVELKVVKQIESGKIEQNSHTLRRICHALDVEIVRAPRVTKKGE